MRRSETESRDAAPDARTDRERERDDREREHEERRQRRGETDVNYGASEEQVPEIGWVT